MIEETLLKFLSILLIFLSFAPYANADTFSVQVEEDRQKLFYKICIEALKETPKAWLCKHYAPRVEGESFSEVFRSMQYEFNNLARRNKAVPQVILTEKRTRKEFNKLFADREPEYIAEFFGEQTTVKPGATSVERQAAPTPRPRKEENIDAVVRDLTDNAPDIENKPRPSKKPTAPVVQVPVEPVTPAKPVVVVEEPVAEPVVKEPVVIKEPVTTIQPIVVKLSPEELKKVHEKLYNDSLDEALTKLCQKLINDRGEYNETTEEYCKKFAARNKDKSIDELLVEFKKDPKIQADVLKELLEQLIIAVAKKNGTLPEGFEEFVASGGIKRERNTAVADASREPSVVGEAEVDPAEAALTDAYDRILKSEIEKNCNQYDTKCIDDITKRIYEQRDDAIARLKPAPTPVEEKPVAVAVTPEPTVVVEEPKEPVVELPPARAPSSLHNEVTCNDAIQGRIKELLQNDQNNILGKQFQLTSLKMALQIMEKRDRRYTDNVEEFINRNQKELVNKDNKKLLGQLVDFYRDYGKVDDQEFISKTFNKVKNSNYFKSNTRIYNDSASVMILADVLSNEESRFSEIDAASAWFASTVNAKFRSGTYHNNLTNLSSLTFRVLGKLKNEKPPIKLDKLKASIDAIEKDLAGNYELMRQDIGEKFADCFKEDRAQCNSKDAFNVNFAKSLMLMTSKIKSNDDFNIEVGKSLKGSISGGFKFDFLPGQYK